MIIPMDFWREISSERETAWLLQSETMKGRLLEVVHRHDGRMLVEAVHPRFTRLPAN